MIIEILAHTPVWVWALLAFLIYRGVAAMSPREASPGRMLIVPIVFLVWGMSSLISPSGGGVLNIALFLAALVCGLALGRGLATLSPAPRFSRATGVLAIPGSPITLILVCVAFIVKYTGNVALAMNADPSAHATIASGMAAVGGLFAGLFWGRTLGQFQRALQAEGEAGTPANLVKLIAARPNLPVH